MLYAFEDAVLDYDSCSVSGGVWYSWFDGVTTDNSSSFDVDHIVSLAEAHDSGGANWSRSKKQEFANDARNLVLVSSSSNRSKSDKDVAEWRPMQQVWCVTARMVVSAAHTYGLSVDQAEFDALEEMLGYCGKEGRFLGGSRTRRCQRRHHRQLLLSRRAQRQLNPVPLHRPMMRSPRTLATLRTAPTLTLIKKPCLVRLLLPALRRCFP